VCGKANGTGEIQICNAGHNPPLLARGAGISTLEATGLPLGMFCEGTFTVSKMQMDPGDLLLLYTDGLSEAMNRSEEEYGAERLCDLVQANCTMTPEEFISTCLKDLEAFQSGNPREDDLTVMVIRRKE
jgi:sigma-B regulation protein RsbU (phosphoserine phosphatase)